MKNKVKLAAIAKDEAAYLPEWIFHHLFFGFDEIEIYINNTSDNSLLVLDKIKEKHSVEYKIADDLFCKSSGNFQSLAYAEIAKKSKEDGFTHIMFLDIDEFWTPSDFKTNIHEFIEERKKSDVYLFNWAMHLDEGEFSRCFKKELRLRNAPQVKYLVDLSLSNIKYGVHNVDGNQLKYSLPNDEVCFFEEEDKNKSKVKVISDGLPSDFFVIHRVYRSEKEYVSLLSRGRPYGAKIKNNRFGYYNDRTPSYVASFPCEDIDTFYEKFDAFIIDLKLFEDMIFARSYVLRRYQESLDLFKDDLSSEDNNSLLVALNNITLPDVLMTIDGKRKEEDKVSYRKEDLNKHFDNIRNAAEFFYGIDDFSKAITLIELALEIRPRGPVVMERAKEYRKAVVEK